MTMGKPALEPADAPKNGRGRVVVMMMVCQSLCICVQDVLRVYLCMLRGVC